MNVRTAGGIFFCLVFCLVFSASRVRACSVPVFRYALENWYADPYRVLVFHRGPLSAESQAAVDFLNRVKGGGS